MQPRPRSTLEVLRTQARWRLMGQLLPALPGILMGGVSLVLHRYPEQAFVAWCTQYWWVVIAPGALMTLAVSALIFLVPQRCPACRIALRRRF